MAYLITGGMGCIGSYVIRDLLNAGEKIIVYDFIPDFTIPKMVLTEEQLEQLLLFKGTLPISRMCCERSKSTKSIELSILHRGRCQRAMPTHHRR